MSVINYILENWVTWVFAVISAVMGWGYRKVFVNLKEQADRNEAIANGVQCLLRENIVDNYNKYQDRGFCPIYAKDSIKRIYSAYHNLGGDDVATKLYQTLLAMPEEKDEKEVKE